MSGEYISREAAISKLRLVEIREASINFPAAMLSELKSIPTADVVEVRHGRWIKDGEDGPVYCSECGEEHEWEDYRASYCDACGAKMDGGQNE